MRKAMTAAAAMALLAPLGVSAGDEPRPGEKMETKTEAAEMQKDRAAEMNKDQTSKDVVRMKEDQFSAKDLLGGEIIGSSGERIARVDDLVITNDGEVSSVVFLEGGFLGLGGERGTLDFERVDLVIEERRNPRASISMTQESLQQVAEFDEDSITDDALASDLIGKTAQFQNGDQEATIRDLIVSKDGTVQHVVAQEGGFAAWDEENRVLALDDVSFEQGAGGLVISMSQSDFANARRFEYRDQNESRDRSPGYGMDDRDRDWSADDDRSDQQSDQQ